MNTVFWEGLFIVLIASHVLSQQLIWTTIYPVEQGLHSNAVTALYQDRDARLWVGTAAGDVAIVDGNSWKIIFESKYHTEYISKIISDKKGAVWSINGPNLWRYANDIWTRYGGAVGHGVGKVATRASGSDCWDRQIIGVDPEVFDGIPYIPGDPVDIEFDEEGILWVVSESESMVFSFDGAQISCWDEFSTEKVLYHNPVQVLPLARGRVLAIEISSFPPPIWLYDRDQWSLLPETPPSIGTKLVSNSVGELFGGGRDGLFRFAAERWDQIAVWSTDEVASCSAIALDDSGGIWAIIQRPDHTASLFYCQKDQVSQVSYPHNRTKEDQTSVDLLIVTPEQKLIIGDREGLHIQSKSPTSVKTQSWGAVKTTR